MRRKPLVALLIGLVALTCFSSTRGLQERPIRVLIITGDHGHDWKATTACFQEFLSAAGITVDVTDTPSKDLTVDNLRRYDVLLLNYKDTPQGRPETRWNDANKEAFLAAVRSGRGLINFHHASSAFVGWYEFERCIGGGWRGQGYHGPAHRFQIKVVHRNHPITRGLLKVVQHEVDELYQNSVMFPENEVLCTAYSDPTLPEGTGKDEPILWVKRYGRGRVVANMLGHDGQAMRGKAFQTLKIRSIQWAAGREVTWPVPPELASRP
jgi:type 1 glutamine amidotransferase